MFLYNKKTGVSLEVDAARSRIRRMQRRVFAWADALKDYIENPGSEYRLVMITLTYERVKDWRPNDMRDFILDLRKVAGAGLLAYAWVAELQQRGAVHYHLLVLARRGTNLPYPDRSGLWPFGMSKVENARTVFYICKYVGKEYQKIGNFPRGLRMFSVWISKHVALDAIRRFTFKVSALPVWLADKIREHFDANREALHARRVLGGGWVDDRGRKHVSPWSEFSPELQAYNKQLSLSALQEKLRCALDALNQRRANHVRILAEWQQRGAAATSLSPG